MARTFLILGLLGLCSAGVFAADNEEIPPSHILEVSVSKVRTSCGEVVARCSWSRMFRGDVARLDREFWTTSQWILARKPMTNRQTRRFIEVAKLSTRSTERLLQAFDKRLVQLTWSSTTAEDAKPVVADEELWLSLIALSQFRAIPSQEENLVSLLARFLPVVHSSLRTESTFDRDRRLWESLFYGNLGSNELMREAYLEAQQQLGYQP